MNYDTLDEGHRHSAFSPICSYCIHLTNIGSHACDAFQRGIPDEIWNGKNDHTEPYPGDLGIRFERRKPKQETNE